MFDYQRLRNLNLEELKRVELGTNLRFDESLPYVQKIAEYLLTFEGRESTLTQEEKQQVGLVYQRFSEFIAQILSFQIQPNESGENTRSRRLNLIRELKNFLIECNEKILPVVTSLKLEGKNINEVVFNAQNKILEIDNTFNSKIQNFEHTFTSKVDKFDQNIIKAEALIKEANKLKNDAENFSVEALVAKYGAIFKSQANTNRKIALWSLGVLVISLILLIIFTVCLFSPIIEQARALQDNKLMIEYFVIQAIYRLTLLTICFIFAKESLKSFNINMHLYNLNLHRQNSLESFNILISSTSTPDIRDHIIKEIAQTIYSNQDDGYLQADKKKISLTEITELVKALR